MSSAKVFRKRFIVNRQFQLGFILLATLFLGLTSVSIGISIPWLFQSGVEGYVISIGIIALTLIFITLCVAFSHSIAGPLYKISVMINEISEGNIPDETFQFRKTDHFQWLANDFNKLIGIIRNYQFEKQGKSTKIKARA